ncbi:MAG: hypothetical protein H6713_00835 [Myxococcales bacterium]|nr:hypothetical protein [Myxococcales bacterium]
MRGSSALLPSSLCLALVAGALLACNGAPAGADAAAGLRPSLVKQRLKPSAAAADYKRVAADGNKIIAPDMVQDDGTKIIAPDMVQDDGNKIIAPDMVQDDAQKIIAPDMVQDDGNRLIPAELEEKARPHELPGGVDRPSLQRPLK